MNDLSDIAAERVSQLLKLGAAALRALPEATEEAGPPNTEIKLWRYHTVSPFGEHVIVLQVFRERLLGMAAAVVVDGFVVDSAGAIRPLTEEEKWPYT